MKSLSRPSLEFSSSLAYYLDNFKPDFFSSQIWILLTNHVKLFKVTFVFNNFVLGVFKSDQTLHFVDYMLLTS